MAASCHNTTLPCTVPLAEASMPVPCADRDGYVRFRSAYRRVVENVGRSSGRPECSIVCDDCSRCDVSLRRDGCIRGERRDGCMYEREGGWARGMDNSRDADSVYEGGATQSR